MDKPLNPSLLDVLTPWLIERGWSYVQTKDGKFCGPELFVKGNTPLRFVQAPSGKYALTSITLDPVIYYLEPADPEFFKKLEEWLST